jgi:exoribonuclease-2
MSQLKTSELNALARQALIDNNFAPDFTPQVIAAAESLDEQKIISSAYSPVRDLRSLLWSSIDNATSLDLDQVEYAEKLPNGDIRLLVGIADVDAFVPKDSVIDRFAARNITSIYVGSDVFPMLPERLSTDLTSLREGVDRLAVVIEMIVSEHADVQTGDVFPALLRNRAKLSYEEIGAWLDGKGNTPESVSQIEGMERQIRLQYEAAVRLHNFRKQKGALEFETIEAKVVINSDEIADIKVERRNAARDIIENFMIAANVQTAEFLENRNVPSLRRVVKNPQRWNRIVAIARNFGEDLPENPDSLRLAEFLERRKSADRTHYPDLSLSIIKLLGAGEYVVQEAGADAGGHFGLAVSDYTHSTAPNRRYVDLIVQRLIKATVAGKPSPYTFEELNQIAANCNERESAARKVERQMNKTIAGSIMSTRIGEEFDAIVTGINERGTFARVLNPPVDGRIVEGDADLQIGDEVCVRLTDTDVQRGFIDFACVC